MLGRQAKGRLVTGGQELGLTPIATLPDWADGMDDPAGIEIVGVGDTSLTGRAATNLATFFQQAWSGGMVNGCINATTPEKRGIGSVYDRVGENTGEAKLSQFCFRLRSW